MVEETRIRLPNQAQAHMKTGTEMHGKEDRRNLQMNNN